MKTKPMYLDVSFILNCDLDDSDSWLFNFSLKRLLAKSFAQTFLGIENVNVILEMGQPDFRTHLKETIPARY